MSSRPKEFQSRSSASSKPEKDAAVFINLRTCSELYKKQKVDIQKLHQILILTHSRSMNLKTVQGDMARTLDVTRSEIRRDRLQRWDKMDTTLLFGINFGRIRTRWKGKFVHFAMEQCFSTGSVLEIERKIREDAAATRQQGIEGGDDDVKQ